MRGSREEGALTLSLGFDLLHGLDLHRRLGASRQLASGDGSARGRPARPARARRDTGGRCAAATDHRRLLDHDRAPRAAQRRRKAGEQVDEADRDKQQEGRVAGLAAPSRIRPRRRRPAAATRKCSTQRLAVARRLDELEHQHQQREHQERVAERRRPVTPGLQRGTCRASSAQSHRRQERDHVVDRERNDQQRKSDHAGLPESGQTYALASRPLRQKYRAPAWLPARGNCTRTTGVRLRS